ncbi:DUF3616 domain-containing protein [Rhizobium grahamii]|uniref:DUF3616 domain-containing protein n=1 Tax=Rhizobium grahamii TaxID=1120045 RepID=A0A370KHP5_9HYPH|nr:DUF3616 domain-containing protein [Rhizobium grahamii]RDJ05055.1 hypothetical protein B5K06_26145 [Rhizobium grahamii]
MSEVNVSTLHLARRIVLDYVAPPPGILENLSGCAANESHLWTVSDEGRSIERLERHMSGYRFDAPIPLDDLIPGIPGDPDDELDLESLDFADSMLWICGSHCKARRKPQGSEQVSPVIRERNSRRLLARIKFQEDGQTPSGADFLPFDGVESLRDHLEKDPFLSPYKDLPTKEGGFDIEGLAVVNDNVFLGLRGPVVGGFAVIVELALNSAFRIVSHKLHFVDLGGLAVRELARNGSSMLIIAGPVGEALGPFSLQTWQPGASHTERILTWDTIAEKPEGMCCATIDGEIGLLLLHDSPSARINGAKYEADWLVP